MSFGESATNLQMLMKDKVSSIYLTDDEMKAVHVNNTNGMIDGNSKVSVMNAIHGMDWE